MKFNKKWLKEKWASYTIAMCSAVVLYLMLTHLGLVASLLRGIWKIGAPVFMAFIIAYILDPLVRTFSTYVVDKVYPERLRHTLAVLLSVLTVVLFFVILMVALVPQIVDSIMMFAKNLNGYVFSFQSLMLKLSRIAAKHDIDLSKFISSSDELLQSITKILPENVNKLVNASYGFGTRVFDWVISFILAIYMMMDNEHLKAGFVRLTRAVLPEHAFQSTATFWSRCNKILVQYIAFDILDGLIIGVINWVFMLVMKMPYVAVVSTVVGVTNLAPTFGPMIGAVIGSFILLLVNPWHALWFLLFTLVLQTFDGYILKPRLFGEQFGVSAVWILISLVIGGRLLGVPGILLAIPCTAIGDFVYHDYVIVRLEKLRQEEIKQELLKEEALMEEALKNNTLKEDTLKKDLLKQEKQKQKALEQEVLKQKKPIQKEPDQAASKEKKQKQAGHDLEESKQETPKQAGHNQDALEPEEPDQESPQEEGLEQGYFQMAGDLKEGKPKRKEPKQEELKQTALMQEDPEQEIPGQEKPGQTSPEPESSGQEKPGQTSPEPESSRQEKPGQTSSEQESSGQEKPEQDGRKKQKKEGVKIPTQPVLQLAEEEKKPLMADKIIKTASAEFQS